MIGGVPWYVAVGGLLVALIAIWWIQEGSASRVAWRAERTSKRAAGGVGIVAVGLVGIASGLAQGLATTLGSMGDVLAQFPSFLAQVAIAGLGYLSVSGAVEFSAGTFLAVVLAIMGIGIMIKF